MTEPADPNGKHTSTGWKNAPVIPPSSDGEMAVNIRAMDWAATSLGHVSQWPQALITLVEVILGSSQPMFVVWGADYTLLYNDAYAQILASKHPALGRSFLDVWEEIRADLLPIVESAYDGQPVTMEDITLLMQRKGFQEETHFTFSYTPVRGANGQIGGFFCACMEVTAQVMARREQRRAEEALRELNETLEYQVHQRTQELNSIWELSPDLLVVVDFNGVLLRVNPAWTALLGYRPEELVGRHVNEFVLPDDHPETVDAYTFAAHGGLPRIVNRYRHKNGTLRWISWVAAPAHDATYANGRDITLEREQADALRLAGEALRQSQKLEAIGQLTGGVAHDFNNLLTVIKSSSDMLKRPDLPDARRSRYVAAISDTVDRAAKLTTQLLAFARRQTLKPEVFEACESVRSLSEMMKTLSGPLIEILTDLPGLPCYISADHNQFDSALVNMAVNARDAMGGEGQLIIRVEAVERMLAGATRDAVPGSFVAVSVIDTGSGIATEHLQHIFEPFFTTKGVGKGTGLGLSQVFGFAKQSGGDVTVLSTVGKGSTFTLYLPRVEQPLQSPDRKQQEPLADGRGICVLVVEDNEEVGRAAEQSLEDLGYVPVLVNSAEEALAELASNPDRFDVVFSDVVMPGMNGVELAHRIRATYHDLPVLLGSGYSNVLAQNGTFGFELLRKPYSIEELSRLLRKVAAETSRGIKRG
jgi:PAS domain S-box-containing protein